jgi:hypothetical protein
VRKILFHGTQPTVLPGFGTIEPGLVELPDELAASLIAAGEKTGDYSDPDAVSAPPEAAAEESEAEPHKKARRTPREE